MLCVLGRKMDLHVINACGVYSSAPHPTAALCELQGPTLKTSSLLVLLTGPRALSTLDTLSHHTHFDIPPAFLVIAEHRKGHRARPLGTHNSPVSLGCYLATVTYGMEGVCLYFCTL